MGMSGQHALASLYSQERTFVILKHKSTMYLNSMYVNIKYFNLFTASQISDVFNAICQTEIKKHET